MFSRTAALPLVAIMSVILEGCCGSEPEQRNETTTEEHSSEISGAELDAIRNGFETDEERCEAACLQLADDAAVDVDQVLHCTANPTGPNDVWDPMSTSVSIRCRTEASETIDVPPTCGRRPQGHHAAPARVASKGAWLASAAHLEAASVRAFGELAEALVRHDAPATLVARCHAAAQDEVAHAAIMGALARGEGVAVPPVVADAPDGSLRATAVHNAVEGCVHEAFAAIVAGYQAREADSELREAFTRIAADECVHGQLAWDLHAWLCSRLPPADRETLERALQRALEGLPRAAANQARAAPRGVGWPAPARALWMAERFATLVRQSVSCDGPPVQQPSRCA